jgi:hypothetical protein
MQSSVYNVLCIHTHTLQVTYLNGSSFTGLWHHDAVTGAKGTFTLRQGAADANALQLKVFGY